MRDYDDPDELLPDTFPIELPSVLSAPPPRAESDIQRLVGVLTLRTTGAAALSTGCAGIFLALMAVLWIVTVGAPLGWIIGGPMLVAAFVLPLVIVRAQRARMRRAIVAVRTATATPVRVQDVFSYTESTRSSRGGLAGGGVQRWGVRLVTPERPLAVYELEERPSIEHGAQAWLFLTTGPEGVAYLPVIGLRIAEPVRPS